MQMLLTSDFIGGSTNARPSSGYITAPCESRSAAASCSVWANVGICGELQKVDYTGSITWNTIINTIYRPMNIDDSPEELKIRGIQPT
jgi:hypothetical protein